MRKIFIITAILMFACSSVSLAATATGMNSGDVSAAGAEIRNESATGPLIGKLSAGVSLTVEYNTGTYALGAAHLKGTKIYATASGDTKVYTQSKTPDVVLAADTLGASDTSAFDTGWTEM